MFWAWRRVSGGVRTVSGISLWSIAYVRKDGGEQSDSSTKKAEIHDKAPLICLQKGRDLGTEGYWSACA